MRESGARAALRVSNLRKAYKDVVAVDGIELNVRVGECFGLLGPNGAGKTTTIEICEGLTPADSGEVEVLELRWNSDAAKLRQRLGIQLQETQLSEKLTVIETVRLFRSFFRQGPGADEVIRLVQLEEKRDARVGSLSGGQARRLDLGLALVGDPELVFLDEPTTGFDPGARRAAWATIRGLRSLGKTILLTTHYLEEAEQLSDRVAVLREGLIVAQGRPAELMGRGGQTEIRYRRGGEEVVVHTGEPTRVLHELTEEAIQAGVELEGLEVRRPTLEDVYLSLTEQDETVPS